MSGVLIVRPLAIAATPMVQGTGAANLLTPDPNEAWIAPSLDAFSIDIDMGGDVAVDSFFLGYTNAAVTATWAIGRATGLGVGLTVIKASGPMRAADSDGPRHHAFARLAAPVTSRYFRLTLAQGGGSPLYAGVLAIGLAFEKHREFGPGRTLIDTSARQDLQGGGFGIGDGVTKAGFAWSFIDLSEAETARLWAIKKAVGLTRPIVAVEDADVTIARNDAIHYGLFERFQPLERVNPRRAKWAMAMVEWT